MAPIEPAAITAAALLATKALPRRMCRFRARFCPNTRGRTGHPRLVARIHEPILEG